ncbi:hypothetical protein KAR91_63995 [Candidatus Pacearchaeota archaeon]|nr:hypothetical protein [Candidatus Pacearchaeota archaeon]
MPDPEVKTITADQWNLVAENVTTGFIHLMDTKTRIYRQTYRLTGEAAPTAGDRAEGVKMNFPGESISHNAGIDIYIWCDTDDGEVRVDL